MICDMRGHKKIQLSGPTVHSLYFDLVGRKDSPDKKPSGSNRVNGQMIFSINVH